MRLVRECCWLRLRGWGRSCEAVLSQDTLYSLKLVAYRHIYKKATVTLLALVVVLVERSNNPSL